MSSFYRKNGNRLVLKNKLIKQISDAYENDDNDTFRHATELFDQMFKSQSYEFEQNLNQEIVIQNFEKKLGYLSEVALQDVSLLDRYPLNEKLVSKGINVIYCERLNMGFRYDKHSGDKDYQSGHLHLLGRQLSNLGVVVTVEDCMDENGQADCNVFIEPHGTNGSKRESVIEYIEGMSSSRKNLIKTIAVQYLGKLDQSQRRKPGQDSIELTLDD